MPRSPPGTTFGCYPDPARDMRSPGPQWGGRSACPIPPPNGRPVLAVDDLRFPEAGLTRAPDPVPLR